MKTKLYAGLLLVLTLLMVISGVARAASATSYTWTLNSKRQFTKTQDAYLPQFAITDLGLNQPEDLFVDGQNRLYIADTGNNRIIQYSIENQSVLGIYEDASMGSPKGIYVTQDGLLYVADTRNEQILVFDTDYTLIETFHKPTEVAFGNTPFKPVRIAVDSKKNLYIIGEGVLNGIIQLSNGGKFLGYFATNKVTLDLAQELQNFFFTEAQLSNLQSRVPITMTNVFIDHENVVYSTTIGSRATEHLAKHNTAGLNTFGRVIAPTNLIDLYVDQNGMVYGANLDGTIWIYSDEGQLLHYFGGTHRDYDIAGLFSGISSIAVDLNGHIYAADIETGYIQSFEPTAYALQIYAALEAFKAGRYSQAESLWLGILSHNQMLTLAHDGLGKVYLYTERYREAMDHLKIANSKFYYSQAFWEVRNAWLQQNLTGILFGLIGLFILIALLKRIDKKIYWFDPIRRVKKRLYKFQFIDDLRLSAHILKAPLDGYEDIKLSLRGSYPGSIFLFVWLFAIYLWSQIGRGFLFQHQLVEDIDLNALILGFFAITLLFVVTNYLVSSIQDGDGRLGEIFKMMVYALSPLWLSQLLSNLLSYILTYNEAFMLDLIQFVGVVYTGVLLLVGLQEIHNYTTREAIKSILFSLGLMIIVIIVILIVLIMGGQVYDFLEGLVREVIRNVTQSY